MKSIWRGLCVITLVLVFAMPCSQSSAQTLPVSLYIDGVDTSQYPQVTVRLSAWDANGLPLPDLQPEQITLQEDGGQVLAPDRVEVDHQAPLRVALVIDISGSMAGEPLEDAQVAATRFLDRLSPGDQVAMIAFSEPLDPDPQAIDPQKELGFSTDLAPAYDLIETLIAGGGTHLYNAATKAVRLFESQPEGHRAVLLLSDGRNDPPYIGDPEVPVRLAQETGVPFFIIGLGEQIDEPYLQRLASDTGGLFLTAPRSSELAELFGNLASLLKTQYRLTYTSQLPADGQVHDLRLSLDADGEQVERQVSLGPLPFIPTAAPTKLSTATSQPTSSPPPPTTTPLPSATTIPPTPSPTPVSGPTDVEVMLSNPLSWLLGALIVGGGGWLLLNRRKSKPTPEACAKCGFDMTGRSGACPQCGETRRYPKGNSGTRH